MVARIENWKLHFVLCRFRLYLVGRDGSDGTMAASTPVSLARFPPHQKHIQLKLTPAVATTLARRLDEPARGSLRRGELGHAHGAVLELEQFVDAIPNKEGTRYSATSRARSARPVRSGQLARLPSRSSPNDGNSRSIRCGQLSSASIRRGIRSGPSYTDSLDTPATVWRLGRISPLQNSHPLSDELPRYCRFPLHFDPATTLEASQTTLFPSRPLFSRFACQIIAQRSDRSHRHCRCLEGNVSGSIARWTARRRMGFGDSGCCYTSCDEGTGCQYSV